MNIALNGFSDKELAAKAKDGDSAAFGALSERYLPILKNRANRYSNVVGVDTEDFVQEGMIALFKAVKNFDGRMGIQFNTYAVTCINNSMTSAIKTHMRNAGQTSSFPSGDSLDLEMRVPAQNAPMLLEDMYILQEDSQVFADQIQSLLSNFERQVLRLYLRGNSYLEISGLLSTTTKAVDNALQRIRKKLRPTV